MTLYPHSTAYIMLVVADTPNRCKQLKTNQSILKMLSNIGIDKINIWCKFKVSTVILIFDLQQNRTKAT